MSNALLVITHCPDAQSAEKLARQLIEARAAACVNQLAPCTSTYRWQNNIETVSEVPLHAGADVEPASFFWKGFDSLLFLGFRAVQDRASGAMTPPPAITPPSSAAAPAP